MPELIVEGPLVPPPGVSLTAEEFRSRFESSAQAFRDKARTIAERLNRIWRDGQFQQANIHMIVGTGTVTGGRGGMQDYNSALLINPRGEILDRYYKMHPVMFGEYVPFGRAIPWLYRLTPLSQGLTAGTTPRAFEVGEFRLSPSICFESTVPHLIRGQVVQLARQGTPPDLLVNVTDDGWFWGSSILDLQLACAAFRAVELRRPFLVAANTGLSAQIDGNGIILQRGPRRAKQILVADVRVDRRWSGYQRWGDLPAGVCFVSCLGLLLGCLARRFGSRKVPLTALR